MYVILLYTVEAPVWHRTIEHGFSSYKSLTAYAGQIDEERVLRFSLLI